jgi:hypothetical protein
MIYKILPRQEGEQQIYARIDEDGLCRVTCTAQNPEFQEAIKNGTELQDAEGNTMTTEQINEFIKELP